MRTRSTMFFVAFATLVAVVWLVRGARDGATTGSPSVERTSTTPARAAAPEAMLAVAEQKDAGEGVSRDVDTAQRSAVVATETALGSAPTAVSDRALLVVHVRDAATQQPLADVRAFLEPLEPSAASFSATHVDAAEGEEGQAPRSGADGELFLHARPATSFTLHVVADPSFPCESVELAIPALLASERREVEVRLRCASDLVYFGRVVSRIDRVPIAGARIALGFGMTSFADDQREESTWNSLLETRSESDGGFRVELRSWKVNHARIEARGFGVLYVTLRGGHERAELAQTFELAPSASLAIAAIGSASVAVPGLDVRVAAKPYALQHADFGFDFTEVPAAWRATIGADGACALDDLPADVDLDVQLSRARRVVWRAADPLRLRSGERRELVARLGTGATIAGHASRASGSTCAALELWLVRASKAGPTMLEPYGPEHRDARCDDAGRFVFDDVASGSWWVGPRPFARWDAEASTAPPPLAMLVEIAPGELTHPLELLVHEPLRIRGRVVDSDGQPVDKIYVFASGSGAAGTADAESDSDGRFELASLLDEEYELVANHFGRQMLAPSERVRVRAGAEDVVLRLGRGGVLAGRVIDARGAPCGGAAIALSHADSSNSRFTTETPLDGAFHFGGLVPGRYQLVARLDGNAAVRTDIEVLAARATEGVDLVLSGGALLELRAPADAHVVSCELYCNGAFAGWLTSSGPNGLRATVAAGDVLVREVGANATAVREHRFTVAPGERRDVQLGSDD